MGMPLVRPQLHRLAKKKDFELVFRVGRGVRSAHLMCRYVRTKSGQNRFGFVISKKISLRAVVRNKVRRRLRESVRHVILASQIKDSSCDVAVIALPGIEKESFSALQEEVGFILKKIYV